MTGTSIRFRLTAWYMAVTLTGMMLLGGIVWTAMRVALYASIRSEINGRITGIEHFLELESRGLDLDAIGKEAQDYSTSLPSGHALIVREASGKTLYTSPNPQSQQNLLWQSGTAKVRSFRIKVDYGEPLEDLDQTLQTLAVVLLAMIPLVTLFAGAGGWWMARRALAPVDSMTATAQTIGMTELEARLQVPPTGDELTRLADAFNQLLSRVHQGVQQIRRFTADAAHELRTPVAIIRSAAEIALRRPREMESYQETLRTIAAESMRLSELLDQLLFLARNDSGALPLHREEVDLRTVADDVAQSLASLADPRQIHVQRLAGIYPAKVLGDRASLRRLVLILVENAIKYSQPGCTVKISDETAPGRMGISVADNGRGIREEDLPLIFDRFYRSETSRTSSGFGLGLSIAKVIAEAHQGEIRVESKLGAGSKFTLLLPAAPSTN